MTQLIPVGRFNSSSVTKTGSLIGSLFFLSSKVQQWTGSSGRALSKHVQNSRNMLTTCYSKVCSHTESHTKKIHFSWITINDSCFIILKYCIQFDESVSNLTWLKRYYTCFGCVFPCTCPCYSFIPQNEEAQFSGPMLGKQGPILAVFTYAEVMIMNVGLL